MGKAQEFKERKYYKEGIVMNHIGG